MEEIQERSVLLITQDSMTEKMIRIVMDNQGIDLKIADCAIKACKTELENYNPSLIIYDLPDPRKSTIIPCGSLSSFSGRKTPPQVVISTDKKDCNNCTSEIKQRCIFFTKPFRITEVTKKLKRFIA